MPWRFARRFSIYTQALGPGIAGKKSAEIGTYKVLFNRYPAPANPRWHSRLAQTPTADLLYGLTEAFQCLHLGGMVPKTQGDAGRFSTQRLHGFDRHQSMGNLAVDVRGRNAVNLLVFNALGGTRWRPVRRERSARN